MARRSLPSSWPEDMSSYRIIVENDSSSLMISDDGAFVIPASTPGFLLMEFITGGLAEADRRREVWVNLEKEEEDHVRSLLEDQKELTVEVIKQHEEGVEQELEIIKARLELAQLHTRLELFALKLNLMPSF